MNTVIRWNPIREMAAMQSAIDRMFDDTWRSVRPTDSAAALALDVHETEQAYVVSAAVPGATADHINVSMHDDILTISVEVPQVKYEGENPARALLLERSYGKFTRSVRLAQPVNVEAIDANLENGVLTLNLPKTPEAQPRMIPVKVQNSLQSNN